MKYAIISDIHEDYVSLKRILERVKDKEVKKVVCLGDIVGFNLKYNNHYIDSRSAERSIHSLSQNNVLTVRGNHDEFFLKGKNTENLDITTYKYDDEDILISSSSYLYLKEGNDLLLEKKMLFSHFLYPNLNGWQKVGDNHIYLIRKHFSFMMKKGVKISFIGHLHTQSLQVITNKKIFELKESEEYVINPKDFNIINCPPVSRNTHNKTNVTYFDISTNKISWESLNVN